jgi:hypothetical protein
MQSTDEKLQQQAVWSYARVPGQQKSLAQNYSGGAMGNHGRSAARGEVTPKQLDALKTTLRGQLLGPDDEGYEAARESTTE